MPPKSSTGSPLKLYLFTPWLLFVVVVNLPFWFASQVFGLLCKGIFDVEFLSIGIVSPFVPPWATAVLLFAATALDLLSGISVTFLFTQIEALHSIRWTSEITPHHSADLAILGLLILLSILLALIAPPQPAKTRARTATAFAVLFIVCVGLDFGTGHASGLWHADRQRGSLRLSRTPLRSLLLMDAFQGRMEQEAHKSPLAPSGTSSISHTSLLPLALTKEAASAKSIVLVLAESWGRPENPKLDRTLLQPFDDPALHERYNVRKGTVPFHGATIDGEARELCDSIQGFSLIDASPAQFAGCLPAIMNRLGYRTVGIHGFTGRMYNRSSWWRNIGFDELWFKEQLEPRHLPTCPGPFPGICDAAIASWIGDTLQRPSAKPSFVYWVTLNSHLPVPIPNQVEHPASCSDFAAVSQSLALCSWVQLIVNTNRSVAAMALRPSSRPTVFLIVGDHQPPFSTPALRNLFSDTVVPYVLLVPRSETVLPPSPSNILLAAHRTPRSTRRAYPRGARASRAGD